MDDVKGGWLEIEIVEVAHDELCRGVTAITRRRPSRSDGLSREVRARDAALGANELSEVQCDGPGTAADVKDALARTDSIQEIGAAVLRSSRGVGGQDTGLVPMAVCGQI
jgi:hypothetical protein